ncbi:MAG: fatty acid desaturase [Sphingobacteriia bacterium]
MGLVIAVVILCTWGLSVAFGLSVAHNWASPLSWLWVAVQTHLYTGLFITAHDAMHGTVHPRAQVNRLVGWLAAGLFAYNYYPLLIRKHHQHHRFVATAADPDFHTGSFLRWYLSFLRQYIRWPQLLLMALTFNVLKYFFPLENVLLFWMLPAVLSTFQLFVFGTWLPHRGTPANAHHARSQRKNHLWAFVSCYFFGYHYEHHHHPGTPWWRLWAYKA